MADFSAGWRVLYALAENDWYGLSAAELSDKLGWTYQKTQRTLVDLKNEELVHQAPNLTWRLSENFLAILVAAQASFLDRLNSLQSSPAFRVEIRGAEIDEKRFVKEHVKPAVAAALEEGGER